MCGCLLQADDIVLLSPSYFGISIAGEHLLAFWNQWDIKYNALESQFVTFGGNNP